MPELPTYTASGNIRGGPVASSVPEGVMTRPWSALGQLGDSLIGASSDASRMAAIAEQRKKEAGIGWAVDRASEVKDALIKWEHDPENQGREDFGEAYRAYADEILAKTMASAPDQKAAEVLKRSITPSIQSDWDRALRRGEQTRLDNFKAGQIKSSIVANEAYRLRFSDDPGAAAELRNAELTNQLALIETAYGGVSSGFAQSLKERAVIDAVVGTMEADPALARDLLEIHQEVDAVTRDQLLGKIEQAERSNTDRASFNDLELIKNSVAVGYEKLQPVPMPDDATLAKFSPNERAKIVQEVKVANGTIKEFSKIKSWRWDEQQRHIAGIDITGDPIAQNVREKLAELTKKSQEQQQTDPAGWIVANNPEFANVDARISLLPQEQQASERALMMRRLLAFQGPPPEDASPDEARQYLNQPSSFHNILTKAQAVDIARRMNAVKPNELTQSVDAFNAEYGEFASVAWKDLQQLPDGAGKLIMGIRVATAIKEPQVRNAFLAAQRNSEPVKDKQLVSDIAAEVVGNTTLSMFVQGWKGDGSQRRDELDEFEQSINAYALSLASPSLKNQGKGMKAPAAVELAVKQVISDNYGIVSVKGSHLPIHKHPENHKSFTNEELNLIGGGIQAEILKMNVDQINTDPFHFPIAERLPKDSTEKKNYLQRTIMKTATPVIEPDGLSFTIYARGEGENDQPFQLRDADGKPFKWEFDAMIGRSVERVRELQFIRPIPLGF